METETEDDLLLFPGSLDAASSGSLSSSVSLSDKSVSTDNNVEEFLGDVPFAGVTSSSSALGPRVVLLGLVPSMCASVAQDDDASMRSCAKRERGVRWSSRSVTSAWTSRLSARGHQLLLCLYRREGAPQASTESTEVHAWYLYSSHPCRERVVVARSRALLPSLE
uniref:Uncharacterized protein n=1 Tax=Timema bartmani TaxID=61472 RepID=A0A7R9I1E2_9NEOP|nr:unnamed protein product [Timema bartmani]